ncbi:MAG: hypothetical protein A3F72_05040 [Bacteroidetes bacterium RIFCSPLOWO2_12_FULL_35_15]|nr:MAG: hypothetical protein A3F72_05040 [Bacteroidetes bacterium RIFCSPLOWO2_12_FULL_35_15]
MKSIELVVGSPVDYKELVVYLRYEEQYLALIQKEDGIDNMKIEFFELEKEAKLDLNEFLSAIQEAKKTLLK